MTPIIYTTPHPVPTQEPCQGMGCIEILREMVASIERGELSDEMIMQVDRIPGEHPVRYSESGMGTVVGYIQGCNFAADIRERIIKDLQWELGYVRQLGFEPLDVIEQLSQRE